MLKKDRSDFYKKKRHLLKALLCEYQKKIPRSYERKKSCVIKKNPNYKATLNKRIPNNVQIIKASSDFIQDHNTYYNLLISSEPDAELCHLLRKVKYWSVLNVRNLLDLTRYFDFLKECRKTSNHHMVQPKCFSNETYGLQMSVDYLLQGLLLFYDGQKSCPESDRITILSELQSSPL